MSKMNQDKRIQIMEMIEKDGPADLKSIHERIGGHKGGVQQLLRRMVWDGWLATFPNSPRTYYTLDISKLQKEGTHEDQ